MKMLIGVAVGLAAAWLYRSERARKELQHRLSEAPQAVQHLQQTAASAAATGAQRVAELIDSAPVSAGVKDTASGAAFNVWATADKLAQTESGTEVSPGSQAAAPG